MTYPALARRSGVSEPTVKRMLGGQAGAASFSNVAAVASALGLRMDFVPSDPQEFRRAEARSKAAMVARLVQGTSGLENQGVDAQAMERLAERTYHELLAGSPRRLWAT